MSRQDFVDQLRVLGYDVEVLDGGRVVLEYPILVGSLADQRVKLGFEVQDDFPLNPPGGPHVCPRIHPIHTQNDIPHPLGAVHESKPFGKDWQYWSRPFPAWANTDRSAREYMIHIYRLFATQ